MSEHESERRALVAACRQLAAAGLSPGSSGNVSLRVGESILLTPTGSALSRVQPEELATVDLGAGDLAGSIRPGPKPSKELPVHLAVYRARPGTGAVVHLHSPYATAISCLQPGPDRSAWLPDLTPYRVMRLGSVPIAPYAPPGSSALGDGVAGLAGAHPVLLLANHGSVVAAPTLTAAVDLAEELETAAQVTLLLTAHLEHRPPVVALSPDAAARLRPTS